ncbi:metallophosphoesterase [Klebsiella pneumoniae]|nr:metallophosphoesterase [Klebsiella pneumoniae]
MKKALYALVSDQHYHNWSAFSTTDVNGLNSRLRIQLDATLEAARAACSAGARWFICAGDTFHVRGSLSPTVLYYVKDTYRKIREMGLEIIMLAGNHDLESNDSVMATNAAATLHEPDFHIHCRPGVGTWALDDRHKLHMVSWYNNHKELVALLKKVGAEAKADSAFSHDVVIHAPINKAIPGMPDVGVEAEDLAGLGFRYVLSGHYHNHKEVVPGVISIGALTHHNWGDLGTQAGYMMVYEDGTYAQFETSAPKFIELEPETAHPAYVAGNYVRLRAVIDNEEEGVKLKLELAAMKPKGIATNFTRRVSMIAGSAATSATSSIDSLESSVSAFCKMIHDTDGGFELARLTAECSSILLSAEEVGE